MAPEATRGKERTIDGLILSPDVLDNGLFLKVYSVLKCRVDIAIKCSYGKDILYFISA